MNNILFDFFKQRTFYLIDVIGYQNCGFLKMIIWFLMNVIHIITRKLSIEKSITHCLIVIDDVNLKFEGFFNHSIIQLIHTYFILNLSKFA